MTLEQIYLCWALMFFQGSRRLYECLVINKSSKSRMWILHWAMGLAFYTAMSMAVWVEGLRKYACMKRCNQLLTLHSDACRS
jgi:3-oxo-5-alpha-steroid 4-dehydrogenase 3 / polyprenol reductase